MPPRRVQPPQPKSPTTPEANVAPEVGAVVAAALAEDPPPPERKADGTFAKGQSGNAGGRTRTQRAFRHAMVNRLPTAYMLLDRLAKSEKPSDWKLYLETVFDRGMGKRVKGSELPDLRKPKAPTAPVTTGNLLEAVRTSLAQGVVQFQLKQAAGELSMEDLVLLGQLSGTLTSLAKEERAQKEEGEERNLAELASLVRWLEGLPVAERQAFFERIQSGGKATTPAP